MHTGPTGPTRQPTGAVMTRRTWPSLDERHVNICLKHASIAYLSDSHKE